MKRAMMTVAVALLLVTAGCMGGGDSAPVTPEPEPSNDTTTDPGTEEDQMTDADTDSESNETTPDPSEFQTGNQTGSVVEAIDGETFRVYYADYDAYGVVKLADVSVPGLNASNIDPSEYNYHTLADDAEAQEHREALRAIGYEASTTATDRLGGSPDGRDMTVVHTGETTADGTPLVYIYFDWDGRETLYNEYVVGFGLGVLTNPDSPHADGITEAQTFARENDEGLWANNDADE